MRLGLIGQLALAVILLLTATSSAQEGGLGPDVRYWPLREIQFPVPIDKISNLNPRPSKLRFFAAPERGEFKQVAESALNDLEVIDPDTKKRGFRYTSPGDGAYKFALQFVYPDGDTRPRFEELTAQYQIVFDTRPPLVRVATSGPFTVEWAVEDENPDTDGVNVEVRWQGTSKWTPISVPSRRFGLRDKYTWESNQITASQPLEVRVVARDMAGLEMASQPITLPAKGGTGLGGTNNNGAGFGGIDDFPARPQIDYINTKNLTIESKLTRITRSGVKTANLWVNDGRGGWKMEKEQTVNITPSTADPTIRIPYTATQDGLYGFIVIPVNAAGGKQDDPKPNDQPQFLIEVDTEKPFVKIKNVRVTPGGITGERVEIEWEAVDKNLMPDPIVLEYSEGANGPWKRIAEKIPNTGRYVWEADDKQAWKIYLRASAVDKASNRGEHIYEKPVIIDLDKPQAVIDRVHAGPNGAGSNGNNRSSKYEDDKAMTLPKSQDNDDSNFSPLTPAGGSSEPEPKSQNDFKVPEVAPAPQPQESSPPPIPTLPGLGS